MLRKVFRTGNSFVVSLPRDMLEPLGIAEGEDVSVEFDRGKNQIIIRPAVKQIVPGVDEEFAHQVQDFIKQYRPALEKLARK